MIEDKFESVSIEQLEETKKTFELVNQLLKCLEKNSPSDQCVYSALGIFTFNVIRIISANSPINVDKFCESLKLCFNNKEIMDHFCGGNNEK